MIRQLIPILLLLFASSCVATQADIDQMRAAFEDSNRAHAADFLELQRGTITAQEFRDRLDERNRETAATINEVKQNIERRVSDTLESVTAYQGATGNPLIDLLIGGAATVGASVVATNKLRDNQRRMLGEPTKRNATYYHPPPDGPPQHG